MVKGRGGSHSEGGVIEGGRQNQNCTTPKTGVARSRVQVEGLASDVLGTELEKAALGSCVCLFVCLLFLRGSSYVALAVLGLTI